MKKFSIKLVLVFGLIFSQYLLANLTNETSQDISQVSALADKGDIDAQFNLGVIYDNGKGVEQDYQKAVKYYKLAADQGHAKSQFNLGVMYSSGQGVKLDYKEAVKYYKSAADQGIASAQNNLGNLYYNGQGVEKNYQEAMKYFAQACDNGEPLGCDTYKKIKLPLK